MKNKEGHSEMRRNFLVPEKNSFKCEHCSEEIMGGRYNNHCPSCLWSKHVDEEIPGDRMSDCGGMMTPVGVIQKHGKWRIIQECVKCSKSFIVDSAKNDNFDLIIKLSQKPTAKKFLLG